MSRTEELFPIAVLIDELKHEEVQPRLNAIRRLSTIALALGVERARDELIPFIEENIEDEDEVLLALAEELAGLVEHVGGKGHAHVLLAPLENLAAVEETVVRDKAVESMCKVIDVLSTEQIQHSVFPTIKRLSSGDWFTSRTSACGLFAAAYPKAPPAVQDEMRKIYLQLCGDETPMVRRAAATHLARFVRKLKKNVILAEFVNPFNTLAQDDQDSVRLLAVDIGIAIAETIASDDASHNTAIQNTLNALCHDKSWRVRYMVADKIVLLAKAVGRDFMNNHLIVSFVHILKDPEAEVRTAACAQVPGFSSLIDPSVVLREIIPCIKELVMDSSQHVRAAMALHISALAPILGKESTIEHLVGMFLSCLKDEFSEVRLNVISKLEHINQVIGIDLLSQSLLPAIVELAEDKQWRVRLAIIEYMPLLAKQLGAKFFEEKLLSLCMSWLADCVFSIREAATHNLSKLVDVFGVEWGKVHILPKILPMASTANFLHRMTAILALSTLAQSFTAEAIKENILSPLVTLASDSIPNIRFNTAKAFEKIIPALKKLNAQSTVMDTIKPVLSKMTEDEDVDVRYFAGRALSAI